MDLVSSLWLGLQVATLPVNLFYCFLGVFIGTFVGVLPGIGALAAISLLLPFTFHLEPATALVMLAGVYYGAEYGGSTASILLNLPGSASNAVTCLDGYPMSKQGRAGVALFMTAIASFFGGTVTILMLIFVTPLIVTWALAFGPADYFALMVLGLVAAGTITRGSPVKGLSMVCVGVLVGSIGLDMSTAVPRFNFGFIELFDGIGIVPVAMGLFGVSEIVASINSRRQGKINDKITLRSMVPTREDVRRSVMPTIRGTAVGSFFGPLPGIGPTIATFLAYAWEKRVAKDPSRFGQGAIEGITSPEASNNAAVQTSFIPTLSLGIPGSPTMAIMLGALMIHGIAPGPSLMGSHPEVFWGLIMSFWIGNVLLLVLNLPLIGIWVSMLRIPYHLLYPAILCFICIGAYSVNGSIFDVVLVLVFGLAGYGMRLCGFEPAPLLIGFILGPMIEENLRRALVISHGDYLALAQRPIAGTVLALTLALLVWLAVSAIMGRRRLVAAIRAEVEGE